MQIPLLNNYSLLLADNIDEFDAFLETYKHDMYPDTIDLNLGLVLSKKEKEDMWALAQNSTSHYRVAYYILHGTEKIGWFMGAQYDQETFYMNNTAVAKEHRGKGVYTALLPVVLKIAEEKGFQKVCSYHATNNNPIIIAKLKQGFLITGMKLSDKWGLMIQLTYYFNKMRRGIVAYRTGNLHPTEEMAKALGLK